MNDDIGEQFLIPTITVDESYRSVFAEEVFPASWRSKLLLSEQVSAVNFRWRSSEAGYRSDWHVAGDPTLIIVLSGCLRVCLRDGTSLDFSAGSHFIAKDYLPKAKRFDDALYGHRAEVMGTQKLEAIHIKLSFLSH